MKCPFLSVGAPVKRVSRKRWAICAQDPKLQLRDHDTMLKPGIPDVIELERVDVNVQTTTVVHEDVSNEETTVLSLEEEESAVPLLQEQVLVITTERHDLALRPTETFQILSEAAEDLRVGAVLGHFIDSDDGLCCNLADPPFHRTTDPRFENVTRESERLLAVGFSKFDHLVGEKSLQTTNHVLGEFRKSGFHDGFYHCYNFVTLGENPALEVPGIEHPVRGELLDRLGPRLASRRRDHVDPFFSLA